MRNDRSFTASVYRQVLLEMFRRQQSLRFTYSIPPRVSLETALDLGRKFMEEKSGGDRALALAGALFDAIGIHFGLFHHVNRARINASDEAIEQAADLECVNAQGKIMLTVEVKDRTLTLADLEGTLRKSRQREIKDIFFAASGIRPEDRSELERRVARAFAAGQNLYLFDFFDLARSVLALGGEPIRTTFLHKIRRASRRMEHPTAAPSGLEKAPGRRVRFAETMRRRRHPGVRSAPGVIQGARSDAPSC